MSSNGDRPSSIGIGQVLTSQGNRGEVRIKPLTDFPERFEKLDKVTVRFPNNTTKELAIESVRHHRGLVVIKFAGVNDIDAAQELREAVLEVGPGELVELPPDHYFVFDLIGLQVVEENGQRLGELRDVLSYLANDVYVVRTPDGREVLLPATKEVVRSIDLGEKLMVIKLLPGLLD